MSPEEAKDMLNTWVSKGEQLNDEWNERSQAKAKEQVKKLGFVTKEEYERLEERIKMLENQQNT